MNIVIIQYNAGNTKSVQYALQRIGANAIVTSDIEVIAKADKVIFPGVGEASTAMQFLQKNKLDDIIKNLTQPTLGICLGMQLMCSHSEENNTNCLDIFKVGVKKFTSSNLKIPHVGWNNLQHNNHPLFTNIAQHAYCYFVHSYYVAMSSETIAHTNYESNFSCAIHKNNFYGVQFHPEKSALIGEQILKNFLTLT